MTGYESALVAFMLGYCFFALGDFVLDRRSDNLFSINQSFLTGLSIAAICIFPLSLIFPGNALLLVLVALLMLGCASLYRRLKERSIPRPGAVFWMLPDPVVSLFFFVIAALFLQFWLQNFRLSYLWDGYQIWATKAMVLYHDGALGKKLISSENSSLERILDYPPMLPLYEALLARFRGAFEWNALKGVFDLFYISLLISTYDAALSVSSRRVAMGVTALLALVPEVSTRFSIGGYADMPQAALVAGATAALLRVASGSNGFRSPIPWLISGIMFVKSEGVILTGFACAGVAAFTLMRPLHDAVSRIHKQWTGYVIVAVCYLVRHLMTIWLHITDLTYGPLDHPHLTKALVNLALIPTICLRYATELSEWGAFWPAFVVAAVIVLVAGSRRERVLTLATLGAAAAYTCIFYFTNWSIPLHIDQAYDRLLTHLSPVSAVVMAAAFQKLWGTMPEPGKLK